MRTIAAPVGRLSVWYRNLGQFYDGNEAQDVLSVLAEEITCS